MVRVVPVGITCSLEYVPVAKVIVPAKVAEPLPKSSGLVYLTVLPVTLVIDAPVVFNILKTLTATTSPTCSGWSLESRVRVTVVPT